MPHETLARNDFKSAERRPNRSLVIFGSGTRYRNAMLGFTHYGFIYESMIYVFEVLCCEGQIC